MHKIDFYFCWQKCMEILFFKRKSHGHFRFVTACCLGIGRPPILNKFQLKYIEINWSKKKQKERQIGCSPPFSFTHITIPFQLPIYRAIAPHGSITQFRWLVCPAMGLALPFPVVVIIPILPMGIPRLQSVMCSKVDQPRIVCSKYTYHK